mgnify:CR=1 FL=1
MNEENSLLTGAVRPALLRYALPIILSMVATQFYAVADTMIIGLRLDADALAAVSNASTVLMIFLFISGGMELGGGLLVAAGKPTATKHEMTELLYNLLFVDEVIALLTTAVGFVTLPALLRLINTPAEILDTAVLYGRIYLMGLPFLMPYDLSKECVMGCGDSKTPLKVIVATSAMNIVLDLVLVGPFGVAGAAAATAAAQVAGAVYMVAFLRRTQMDAAFSLRMLKARYARDIFRLSAPNSIQQASGTIITTVKQGLLGGLGVEAIAGFSCAGKLSSLLMMPVFGFVQSTVFFIAQNTAALQPGRVKEGLREGRRILLVYSLGVMAVCIGLRGPLLRLFTTDPAAASYGCTMLAFESVTYLFVAHDLSMVRHISDRIGVMYLGKIVESGDSDEVYDNPCHPYTRALLASIPIADPKRALSLENCGIEGDLPSPLHIPSGCRFHTRCPYATEQCRQQEPELEERTPGHMVACWKK